MNTSHNVLYDNTSKPLPTYFISHGGGPWPWLKSEMPYFSVLESFLADIPRQIEQNFHELPKAILVVSGHWEEDEFTVMSNPHPSMIYDYSGFPEHTYHVKYEASGAPALAQHIQKLLADMGIPARLDNQRGFGHGVYVPLFVMYPDADFRFGMFQLTRGVCCWT